jgi:hypothetical protein
MTGLAGVAALCVAGLFAVGTSLQLWGGSATTGLGKRAATECPEGGELHRHLSQLAARPAHTADGVLLTCLAWHDGRYEVLPLPPGRREDVKDRG